MRYRKKEADEKLRDCLIKAMELDDEKMNEEMKQYEEHVFSEKFEQKMQELITVQRKKSKKNQFYRYAVSIAAVMLLVFGTVSSTFIADASMPSIDVKGWFEKYFEFDKGSLGKENGEIEFTEKQITYIPVGFVKTEEENKNTYRNYVYENEDDKYFCVRVSKTLVRSQQDSEDILQKELKGENGYVYTMITQAEETTYIWEDQENLYYYVTGNIEKEELMRIMNSIQEETSNEKTHN